MRIAWFALPCAVLGALCVLFVVRTQQPPSDAERLSSLQRPPNLSAERSEACERLIRHYIFRMHGAKSHGPKMVGVLENAFLEETFPSHYFFTLGSTYPPNWAIPRAGDGPAWAFDDFTVACQFLAYVRFQVTSEDDAHKVRDFMKLLFPGIAEFGFECEIMNDTLWRIGIQKRLPSPGESFMELALSEDGEVESGWFVHIRPKAR